MANRDILHRKAGTGDAIAGKWSQTSLFRYFAFAALDRILFRPII
jgi:hypothetical protein